MTKIHALTDASCRPIAFMLTGGNVADCVAGAELLARLPACEILHGDKGYDSDAIRRQVEKDAAMPNIRLIRPHKCARARRIPIGLRA